MTQIFVEYARKFSILFQKYGLVTTNTKFIWFPVSVSLKDKNTSKMDDKHHMTICWRSVPLLLWDKDLKNTVMYSICTLRIKGIHFKKGTLAISMKYANQNPIPSVITTLTMAWIWRPRACLSSSAIMLFSFED